MNIFLTVGSQMPFDRLTLAVAQWARKEIRSPAASSSPADGHHSDGSSALQILAQIGHSTLSVQETHPLQCVAALAPSAYRQACLDSQLIVAHAGMGSILTAMELNRPLIVMPRRGRQRETRNDHQWDTAMKLLELRAKSSGQSDQTEGTSDPREVHRLWVATDEADLAHLLPRACRLVASAPSGPAHASDASPARLALIENLRGVIHSQVAS
jgi:UDP-N-acetylglucosamine transferase subunit ALG13